MTKQLNTVFNFLEEEIETYKIKQALQYVKHNVNRILNSIKCIKKLKEGKTKMYLVRGLIEAKLLIEFCIKNKILNELNNYYEKSCQSKLLNKVTISNDLCCKNIILDLEKAGIKVKKQLIDNRNKCKYIELDGNVLLPVKPSGAHYLYNFATIDSNIKMLNLKDTIKSLDNINKKIKLDENEIYVRWKREIIMY